MTVAKRVSVGLAGFGSAGRGIHAPLLVEAGMTVAAIATSQPVRVEQVHCDFPGARVVDDLRALLAVGDLDLIVLATPSGPHAQQAREVIRAGVPVVVDKPLATNATDARDVVLAAEGAGVPLVVFQNRRFDAEHVTQRQVVDSGLIGDVFRYELRWERWRPVLRDRWRENLPSAEGGGLLLDLHPHLIDEAVDLFGRVESVHAEVAAHTTRTEDDAFLSCRHTSGVISHLGALSIAGAPGPRIRMLGSAGAYLLAEFEQELNVYPGLANSDAAHCGWIYRGESRQPVPRADAAQVDFYRQVGRALTASTPRATQAAMPADPRDAVHVMAVIDAARISAACGTVEQVAESGWAPREPSRLRG